MKTKILIGRNEWCSLPDLGIPLVKAKIDTGAKTSALHAFNIELLRKNKKKYVTFDIHPIQGNNNIIVHCNAPFQETRSIMSSNGSKELRYIIKTTLRISKYSWEIEVSLSNRDPLRYRMLLGREALKNGTLINPNMTMVNGQATNGQLIKIYRKKLK